MQITVYVLESLSNKSRYVGVTKNLGQRLKEHNSVKTRSTKGNIPWKVIHTENTESRVEGRKREKYLKSAAGRRYLQKILASYQPD